MNTIVDRRELTAGDMISLTIEAPAIARKTRPGQFIILRANETGERIPLTVAHKDVINGTITIIFQVVGKTTALLSSLKIGDAVKDLVGPLGAVREYPKVGNVVGIGGGSGTAVLYHTMQGYHEAGNKLIGIIGVRTKDLLILEDEMKEICERVIVTTDDGSYGMHGLVTDALKQLIDENVPVDLVLASGPLVMMRAIANVTKELGIRTEVSLNPIMVDGTGMCGCCRVTVGGETKFACVDGPEFDAHEVDFDELIQRNNMYQGAERASLLASIKTR